MKKINLNFPLTDLAKNPILENGKPMIISQIIANSLAQSQSENSLKMNSICERLYESGEIELDEADLEFFRKNVEKCPLAADRLRGVVLREIANQSQAK